MIWHYFNTITAAMLITLPFQVNGSQCNEKSWNASLKVQQELDESYNLHASRFNQFLKLYQNQPFLFQEFSADEIHSLWSTNNASYLEHMNAQIKASTVIIDLIDNERSAIEPLNEEASRQQDKWLTISRNCQTNGKMINMISGLDYAQLNQALIRDISILLRKLDTLQARYLKEVEALESSRPKPHE
ncbi:hypothetical protein [Vibrio orientalis]|uniref:ATPase n=2 Tax=Vibrio orientalis CIP 102891 = ATCC 33934 TaxID=675816 RepID=A0ABM9Z2R3_VIBOR|nr:hypothetical protein [Vibrio orientalis]EEX93780.1 hypothetical protein VIA_000937 [Vibrio orientalis CIP 102891 = ATCC 33934]